MLKVVLFLQDLWFGVWKLSIELQEYLLGSTSILLTVTKTAVNPAEPLHLSKLRFRV